MSVVVYVCWFFWHVLGFSPPIIVARETTHITAPLRANGLPDYEKYVLAKYREGVTPENNAAVLFWQAMGPVEMNKKEFARIAKEIGLATRVSDGEYLQDIHGDVVTGAVEVWLETTYKIPRVDDHKTPPELDDESLMHVEDAASNLVDQALDRPWTTQQIPPLGAWVLTNERPLDRLVAASRRARFFSPSLEHLNNTHESLLDMTVPAAPASRIAARALSIRAMWQLANAHVSDAWSDIAAIYRLSQLIGKDRTLVEQMVSISIDSIANQATLAVLDSPNLTADLARQIHHDLESLGARQPMAASLDGVERLAILSAVINSHEGNIHGLGIGPRQGLLFKLVDWNVALRKLNHHFDELSAAARLANWTARKRALDAHEKRLKEIEQSIEQRRALGGIQAWKLRSEIVGDIFVVLMLPATSSACAIEDRANTQRILTKLAAAIAVFRAERGEYPSSLAALVPDILEEVPMDLYHKNAFVYRRTNNGYLLYSRGPNGRDDRGRDAKESQSINLPPDADDIAIRLPLPKLELPKRLEPTD